MDIKVKHITKEEVKKQKKSKRIKKRNEFKRGISRLGLAIAIISLVVSGSALVGYIALPVSVATILGYGLIIAGTLSFIKNIVIK